MKDLCDLESITQELSYLERSLASNAKKRERLEKNGGHAIPLDETSSESNNNNETLPITVFQKLRDFDKKAAYLSLARDLSLWAAAPESTSTRLSHEVEQCTALAILLCRHPADTLGDSIYSETYISLLNEEYKPFHQYLREKCLQSLRQSLRSSGYPSEEACQSLLGECLDASLDEDESSSIINGDNDEGTATISSLCDYIHRLQVTNQQLSLHLEPTQTNDMPRSDFVLELCQPILDRLRYHFVETNKDRITTTRTDRLPQWLFNYIREHVFEGCGPWELVSQGIAPSVGSVGKTEFASIEFRNEIVGLAQWVLAERNFFRSAATTGHNSTPSVLCSAIEQLFLFDKYTRDLLPSNNNTNNDNNHRPQEGLVDFFVVSDPDLKNWWFERERESALSTLFQTPLEGIATTDGLLSPGAELFCALVRSFQFKANVLIPHHQASYLGHVAVPACMQFLDVVHGSSTELQSFLRQRDCVVETNTVCWMEIINGTHLASLVLTGDDRRYDDDSQRAIASGASCSTDNDLSRLGRSVQRLRDVLVDEFATTLVENVLMERAKLASYLMRCSHLLSITTIPVPSDTESFSPDLVECVTILSAVLEVCDKHVAPGTDKQNAWEFAPLAIRSIVANKLAEKFLEVALDVHGMTPDVELEGAAVFARDVKLLTKLFGPTEKERFRGLLDATTFMALPSDRMHSLRLALSGLIQHLEGFENQEDTTVSFNYFSSDATLFNEATSMLRAKGFEHLELQDAISILNRRNTLLS